MQADRHLLLGLLALQCGLISDDQLIAAFRAWTGDKQRSIESILLEQQALSSNRIAVLRQLEQELLAQHGQNAEQSLATLSRMGSVRQQLEELSDAELSATLSRLPDHWDEASVPRATNRGSKSVDGAKLRYQTIRLHAKGGIGEVYVAKDGELNREVALKEIQEQFADDEESRARFKLEAEITGNLEHPGIVPVYGLGQYQDDRPFYAMRFIRGDSLKEAIDAFHTKYKSQLVEGEAGLELRKLLRRFVDVCNAVAYAHSRGVLHRDLKPGNIILGKYGETLVVDWGLARAQGQSELTDASIGPIVPSSGSGVTPTLVGSAVGTPAYMSPEQAAGKVDDIGPTTDVYALGATLFHLLTGQLPITGKTLLEIVQKAEKGDLRKLRALRTDIPKSLEAICIKAMAKEPSHRYASPVQFADDIEKWLADEPVSAYTEPISLRVRRWIKRHPAIVSTSAAVILLSLTGALLFAFIQGAHAKELERKNKTISDQVVEVTQQKQKEEKERSRAEAREQDAIAAVKRFSDAVANNPELKNNPKLESLRKELLKEPLGFFKLLKERLQGDKGTSIESLSRLASAAFEFGLLTNEIGSKQDAILAYTWLLAIRERMARENPSVTEYAGALAASHNDLGVLLRETGKITEAQEAYEEAKKIQEHLVRKNPLVTQFASDLAASHYNLGELFSDTNKLTEAIVEYGKAKKIRMRLVSENPQITRFASDLAASHHSLGILRSKTGELAEALAEYGEAKRIRMRLARENPGVSKFAKDLALSHSSFANLLHRTGNLADSLVEYEAAKEICQQLTLENPTVHAYASDLAATYRAFGDLYEEDHKTAEALAAYKEATKIQERLARENPSVNQYASDLSASYINIGNVLRKSGSATEAFTAYDDGKKILEHLIQENPAENDYAGRLALCQNNLGALLAEIGRTAEALEAYTEAKRIQERLVRENPLITDFASDLAFTCNNLGALLSENKEPAKALAVYEEAKSTQSRLASENPSTPEFSSALAQVLTNIGLMHRELGNSAEAISTYDHARIIWERLVQEYPSSIEYRNGLARTHNNIGIVYRDIGNPSPACAAYEEAKKIQERLTRDSPSVAEFHSELGATLSNIAMLDLDANRFADAKTLILAAIESQKRALAVNSRNITYRQFLAKHYTHLVTIAKGLSDEELEETALNGLFDLVATDPRFEALDLRLKAVANGDPARDITELLDIAQRAFRTRRFSLAARWYGEAMQRDVSLVQDRQRQVAYFAARSAALASGDKYKLAQNLDDSEKVKLRTQALYWLEQELDQWKQLLEKNPNREVRQAISKTLGNWQEGADFISIRNLEMLASMPDTERKEWEALWAEVKSLQSKIAESAITPNADPKLPTDLQSGKPAVDSPSPK